MYEEYTDEQIVEMLVPKMYKSVPGIAWSSEFYHKNELAKAIAVVYRSAYIRGQLGRSFIIGEKKKENQAERTGKWVYANTDNVKVGSKVRFIDGRFSRSKSYCYPIIDTVGTVLNNTGNTSVFVQWPEGTTSGNDQWWVNYEKLEVLVCE